MDCKPELSIIMCFYNIPEMYFSECLESLFNQEIDFEVEYVFVNDASTDGTLKILEEYLERYPEIKSRSKIVNNPQNMGLGASRKIGFSNSTGKYIINIDGDDWHEKDMFKKMYHYAEDTKSDVVISDMYWEYPTKFRRRRVRLGKDKADTLRRMVSGQIHCGPPNKMIKRSVYERLFAAGDEIYPEGVNMWEDVATNIPLFYHAEKISYLDAALYHYRKFGQNFYTQTLSLASFRSMELAVDALTRFAQRHNLDWDYLLACQRLIVKKNFLWNSRKEDEREVIHLHDELSKNALRYKEISLFSRLALYMIANGHEGVFHGMKRVKRGWERCRYILTTSRRKKLRN